MGLRNIAVLITGDSTDLRSALIRAAGQVDDFARRTEQGGTRASQGFNKAAAGIAAGVAVVVSGVAALGKSAVTFDANLRSVNTIAGLTEQQLAKTGSALLDLSETVPKTADDVSAALYDVVSSGFAGAGALNVVEVSAKAATAGLTTTATAAKAIDAVLNAYGRSAKDAEAVSDVLFQTVNVGVLNFEDLTGIIGDTVGAAAAAKIPIEQLGAAVATLTLSGISPSEAGTSTARLIDSLIAPSEKLAALYDQLGFTSGEAALKAKGLNGVMEDLRKATGGNVTALLGLFPEIRAARGAFALMANDGKTYARAMGQVADANKVTGATQRAFDEQMKATRQQFQLTVNSLTADSIRLGLKILPIFNDLLSVTRDLGGDAATQLERGFHAVQPTLESLYRSGVNVVDVIRGMAEAAEPAAGFLLKLGGAAILGALQGLAKALEVTSGFLADHPHLVLVLASVYLATLVPSITAVTIAFNRMILTPIVLFLNGVLTSAGAAAAGLRAASLAALSIAAIAAPIFAAAAAFHGFSTAGAEAKARVEEFASTVDTLDVNNALKSLGTLQDQLNSTLKKDAEFEDRSAIKRWSYETGQALQQMVGGKNDILENAKAMEATANAISDLADKTHNAQVNLKAVRETTGLTTDALVELARKGNIDLTGSFAESEDERRKLIDDVQTLQAQTGLTGDAFEKAFGTQSVEAMESAVKALQKLQDETAKAFSSAFDVVTKFDPTGGVTDDAIEKAQQRVEDARQRVSDARERAAAARRGASRAQQQGIARAEEALARAQEDAAKATSRRASASLEDFYRDAISRGTRFTSELNGAIARGLDPAVVQRLLTAGPEQALPILDALAADRKGRLIKLVNAGEQELSRLNTIAVEQARLTGLAIASSSDALVRDLSRAIQISQQVATQGAHATAQSIAKALKLNPAEVKRIADEFGITLIDAVQAAVSKNPVVVKLRGDLPPAPIKGKNIAFAEGGQVPWYLGTPGRDSVHALVMPREYVQPVATVDYYGVPFMEALRKRQLPKIPGFAAGGLVGAAPSASMPMPVLAGGRSTLRVVPVKVPIAQTHTTSAPMNVRIDKVVTSDADTFRQWGRGRGYGPDGFGS
jgi:TP901 family phage tail tape measure protein